MDELTEEQKKALKRVIDDFDDNREAGVDFTDVDSIDILRPLLDEPVRHNIFDRDSMGD